MCSQYSFENESKYKINIIKSQNVPSRFRKFVAEIISEVLTVRYYKTRRITQDVCDKVKTVIQNYTH